MNDGRELFTVKIENAREVLWRTVEFSQNQVSMTCLSNAISPGDVHTTDVQYYKACWRQHVFHELRDDTCRIFTESPANADTMLD